MHVEKQRDKAAAAAAAAAGAVHNTMFLGESVTRERVRHDKSGMLFVRLTHQHPM
jgi:hypothetical protein